MGKINEIEKEVKQSYGSNSFTTTVKDNVVVFDSAKDSFRFEDPIDVAGITVNGEPITPGGNIPNHYDAEDFSLSIGNDDNISGTINVGINNQIDAPDAVIVGDRTYNDGKQSVVVGANARNYGDASVSIGYEAQAHNNNAMALGAMAIAEEGEIALSFGIDGTTYQARQIKLKLDNGSLKISFDNGQTWGTIVVQ